MISTHKNESITEAGLSRSIYVWALIILGFLVSLWLALANDVATSFPEAITDPFSFSVWVNEGEGLNEGEG